MRYLGFALSRLGFYGPALLVISLVLGFCSDRIATAAHAVLPLSAFLLTLGSFLSADLAPPEQRIGRGRMLIALGWIGIAVPLLVALSVRFITLSPVLKSALLLSVIAPPVGSAAALATMLDLRSRLALIASIALTIAAPVSMPLWVALLHVGVELDPGRLIVRLALMIGCAIVLAAIHRRWRPRFQTLLPNARAAAGVAVIGLVIVGLATIQGARAKAGFDNPAFLTFITMAVTMNVGIASLGALVFSPWGLKDALTVGLVAGNRNVTLAWAAVSTSLPAQGEAYLAACVIPVLSLPLVIKLVSPLRGMARRAPAPRYR